jgi:hypothetical protein
VQLAQARRWDGGAGGVNVAERRVGVVAVSVTVVVRFTIITGGLAIRADNAGGGRVGQWCQTCLKIKRGMALASVRLKEMQGIATILLQPKRVRKHRSGFRSVNATQINHQFAIDKDPDIVVALKRKCFPPCVQKFRGATDGEVLARTTRSSEAFVFQWKKTGTGVVFPAKAIAK